MVRYLLIFGGLFGIVLSWKRMRIGSIEYKGLIYNKDDGPIEFWVIIILVFLGSIGMIVSGVAMIALDSGGGTR